MNIILFDDESTREHLLPLSFTRPLARLRVGISTIAEKWQQVIDGDFSYLTAPYLSAKFPTDIHPGGDNLFIAGNVIPRRSPDMAQALAELSDGQALVDADGHLVAFRGDIATFERRGSATRIALPFSLPVIERPYDIFLLNGQAIIDDFASLSLDEAQPLSPTCTVIGPTVDADGRPLIYIAPGASVEGAMLNTTHGPIYIGRDATVMEGSCLRGPLALCPHATINMGTKVYPDTTIGPWSKVGGELNNVVIIGYSNKAHDGFLGNAVIGEWCNLGAGCVASNLKNDYTQVRVWDYPTHRFAKTDLQFCGLIMGDHSKAGINTMFNTATVVGVGVNIHGSGFPRTFIPSFSEGGAAGFTDVQLTKFFDIATRVMARRGCTLTDTDRHIFEEIYRIADTYK